MNLLIKIYEIIRKKFGGFILGAREEEKFDIAV